MSAILPSTVVTLLNRTELPTTRAWIEMTICARKNSFLPQFRLLSAAVTISAASAFYSCCPSASSEHPALRSPHRPTLSSQPSALFRTPPIPRRSFLLAPRHCKPAASSSTEDDSSSNSSGVEQASTNTTSLDGAEQAIMDKMPTTVAGQESANNTSLDGAVTEKMPVTALILYGFLGAFTSLFLLGSPAVEVALIADYFGVVVPLCGIILASEQLSWAVMWCAGCLFMGSPFCSAYVSALFLSE